MNVVLPIKNFFLQYLKKEDISDCWRSVGLSGENTFLDSFLTEELYSPNCARYTRGKYVTYAGMQYTLSYTSGKT